MLTPGKDRWTETTKTEIQSVHILVQVKKNTRCELVNVIIFNRLCTCSVLFFDLLRLTFYYIAALSSVARIKNLQEYHNIIFISVQARQRSFFFFFHCSGINYKIKFAVVVEEATPGAGACPVTATVGVIRSLVKHASEPISWLLVGS